MKKMLKIEIPRVLELNVTDLNISMGIPAEGDACPITLAVERQFETEEVSTGSNEIEIAFENGVRAWYSIPAEASEFIRRFDNDSKVKSFKFKATLDHATFEYEA